MGEDVLTVDNFSVVYDVEPPVEAVKHVSLHLKRGEILGLAGESGCGKTTLVYGIQRLLKDPAIITSGTAIFHDAGAVGAGPNGTGAKDIDILKLSDKEIQNFRWDKISMVFQGAMNALNPVVRIGKQLDDVFRTHRPGMSKAERLAACEDLLTVVGVGPERIKSYPHELSGGMRQRVMIAMALALKPQVMIMDEPTTALDVLVEQQILTKIRELRNEFGFAVIFITHDLQLLLEISDRIAIMKEGEIVEIDTAANIYHRAQHAYTQKLLNSFPSLTGERGGFVRGGIDGGGN